MNCSLGRAGNMELERIARISKPAQNWKVMDNYNEVDSCRNPDLAQHFTILLPNEVPIYLAISWLIAENN